MKLTTTLVHTKYSDKIILAPSMLDSLLAEFDQLPQPLLFTIKYREPTTSRKIHTTTCGVKEFTADPGTIGVPQLVLNNLGGIKEGRIVDVELSRDIPLATHMTLKPKGQYKVDNYEALLESALRANYTALTVGNTIVISNPVDSSQDLEFNVENLSPAETVCIVDTDVNLEVLVSEEQPVLNGDFRSQEFSFVSTLPLSCGPTKVRIDLQKVGAVRIDSDLAFIGISQDTSPKSFIWTTLDGPKEISPNNPFGDEIYIWSEEDLEISKENDTLIEDDVVDCTKCPTCNNYIPNQSYTLHSTFCARNNRPCEHFKTCGYVYKRGATSEHWHCHSCDSFGNSAKSHDNHNHFSHTTPDPCPCGYTAPNFTNLAVHKHTECPLSLHECRFCHLRVPRGVASPQDILSGYSGHESECGSKTTDCHICKKPVRLRDLESHQKLHVLATRDKIAPELCANSLCIRTRGNNPLQLCDTCFGPLYSAVNDPTGARLQSRVERRYVLQMTKGCGRSSCRNKYCISSGLLAKPTMAQVMSLIKEIQTPSFCVDDKTTKRKDFVDFHEATCDYSRQWLAVAIEEKKGNEQEALRWLEYNAPKISAY